MAWGLFFFKGFQPWVPSQWWTSSAGPRSILSSLEADPIKMPRCYRQVQGPGSRTHPRRFRWDPPKEIMEIQPTTHWGYGDCLLWSNTQHCSTIKPNLWKMFYLPRPKYTGMCVAAKPQIHYISMEWTPENRRIRKWNHPLAIPLCSSRFLKMCLICFPLFATWKSQKLILIVYTYIYI